MKLWGNIKSKWEKFFRAQKNVEKGNEVERRRNGKNLFKHEEK